MYLYCDHKYSFFAVRTDELTEAPSNVVTKVHQSVSLHCAGNGRLDWTELITSETLPKSITYAGEVLDTLKDKYSLNTDSGQFELVIKSPVLSDGGKYRCQAVDDVVNKYRDAEVLVIGKIYFHIFGLPSHP